MGEGGQFLQPAMSPSELLVVDPFAPHLCRLNTCVVWWLGTRGLTWGVSVYSIVCAHWPRVRAAVFSGDTVINSWLTGADI